MQKEDKLYRLIHSLSANEKGFFKKSYKHYSNHENILLFKLFDIYNNCNEFDEATIEKAIVKAGIKNQDGKLKSILHKAILSFLISNEKQENALDKVFAIIQEVRMLNRKLLHHDAAILLNKAKKIANDFELYDAQSIILSMESDLFPIVNPNPIQMAKLANKNIAERKQVAQNKQDETLVVQLYVGLLTYLEKLGIQSWISIKEESQTLFNSITLIEKNLSKRNELIFFASKAMFFITENKKDDFFKIEDILFEKMLDKKYSDCLSPTQKISLLSNLRFGFKTERNETYYKRIIAACQTLSNQIPKSQETAIKQSAHTLFYLEIEKELRTKNYDILIDKFLKLLKQEKHTGNTQVSGNLITLYFNLGIIYFCDKKYKEAIKTLNQIYLKTNKEYSPIKESEIIFILILANIKLNQGDTIEILAKDYLTIYQRNDLQLPLRKNIVNEIHKNAYLNQDKMIANIKSIVDNSKEFDLVYSEAIIDLKDWLQNQ